MNISPELRIILLFIFVITISSCKRNRLVETDIARIELGPGNDTISMDKLYSNGKRKEHINYFNNIRVDNLIYDKSAHPVSKPSFFIDSNQATKETFVCILIPIGSYKKCDVYFNGESSQAGDSILNVQFSTDVAVKPSFVYKNNINGVIKAEQKDGNIAFYSN